MPTNRGSGNLGQPGDPFRHRPDPTLTHLEPTPRSVVEGILELPRVPNRTYSVDMTRCGMTGRISLPLSEFRFPHLPHH